MLKPVHRHIGVYAVIVHSNQVLLVEKKRGPYSGKWDLPGGSLLDGEGVIDALQRELIEEVNLRVDENEIELWTNRTAFFDYQGGSFYHIGMLYRVHHFDLLELRLDCFKEDVAGAKWISSSSVSKELLSPFAHFVLFGS